jgi:serine/threonine-protein kinase
VYYDYEEPATRRPVWPWLLALLFVVAAGIGGYFVYDQITKQISSSKPVAVDLYIGMRKPDAVAKIHDSGLKVKIQSRPSETKPEGFVIDQDPSPGDRTAKGNFVTIVVSSGKPQTTIPGVVGQSATDATAALVNAHLKVKAVQINSSKPNGTVTAQDPKGGLQVDEGTLVRINVSKGPAPVAVPSVVGENVATANSQLQAAGFKVGTNYVDSNQPKDTVLKQDPAGSAAKGTTVTLTVSKGPTTSAVPDVTSQDVQTAGQNLHASGFNVHVDRQATDDPTQDGIVLSEDPAPGTQAKPGTVVTIVAGQYSASTETTTTTTTTDTTTTGTTTTGTP